MFYSTAVVLSGKNSILKKEELEGEKKFLLRSDHEFWKYVFTPLLPWESSSAIFLLSKGSQCYLLSQSKTLIQTSDAALTEIAFLIHTKHHFWDWFSNSEYNGISVKYPK